MFGKESTMACFPVCKKTPTSPIQICISQILIEDYLKTTKWCDTADEALEYMVGDDRLRDVITEVQVIMRTI